MGKINRSALSGFISCFGMILIGIATNGGIKTIFARRVGIRPAARARADDGRADCARSGAGASMLSPDAPPV